MRPLFSEMTFETKALMRGKLSHWRTIAGLDFHVLVTLLFRGWSIVAGTATIFLLPLWLSPIEQGYYYTFGSVLALQVFFEQLRNLQQHCRAF